jgi:putative hydrolase of the HAD superfamily
MRRDSHQRRYLVTLNAMTIRAVLFDLGDTLWHFPEMPPAMTIRSETMRRVGGVLQSWGVPMEGDLRFLGRDIRLGVEQADRAAYESDCVSPDFNEVVRQIVADKGLQISYEQAAQLWDAWNLGGMILGRTMFDDAYRTLDWLRDRGVRIGCVTNRVFGGPRFAEELRELGLDQYFDAVAVSCDAGYMKPHPRIFEQVLDEMKIGAAETAMVGDSLRADVQASQSLGMTAVWRRIRKADPPHEAEQLGEATDDDTRPGHGPHAGPGEDTTRPASRAQTGRALGDYREGEGVSPDFEIWNLWELTELPIYD